MYCNRNVSIDPLFCHFEALTFSVSPQIPSSPSSINECMAVVCGGNVSEESSRSNRLNAAKLNRVDVGLNRYATG